MKIIVLSVHLSQLSSASQIAGPLQAIYHKHSVKMRLQKITLFNIKSFVGTNTFDLSSSEEINTVSGINGSGKSTMFKSIIIAQKLFFLELYSSLDTYNLESRELDNTFTSKNSSIKLEFQFDNAARSSAEFSIVCTLKEKDKVEYKLEATDDDLIEIKKYWNVTDPKNLIIYIDSNRNIFEEDFSNKDIRLLEYNYSSTIEYIINPEKIFRTIYERIIKDYIHERIIPSKPRTDLPHIASKILIHELIDYVKITNFSGIEKKEQFTLLLKNNKSSKAKPYDVRNLSSGEKTIFYIYHFICYIKSIGILIIDEPENNLHENMLSNFTLSLFNICKQENFADLIIEVANKGGTKLSPSLKKSLKSYYLSHNLSKVFLLTHSKNLIYNNLSKGKNYIIEEGLKTIDYDDYEKKLREIGLSKIINKVLFVEGKTENTILESIFSPHNIKVKQLGNCSEVIETYKRYLKMKSEIRDVQFCFIIDRDTRSENDINEIRSTNEEFFDEHFIILNRHEIENYFLEPKMFVQLYRNHKTLVPSIIVPQILDINDEIKRIALEKRERVYRKRIQNLNQKSLEKIKLAISKKTLNIDSQANYDLQIDEAFESSSLLETIVKIKNNYQSISELEAKWDAEWLHLCDGKIVFYDYISKVSAKLGITTQRASKEVIDIGLNSPEFEINRIIEDILLKFK